LWVILRGESPEGPLVRPFAGPSLTLRVTKKRAQGNKKKVASGRQEKREILCFAQNWERKAFLEHPPPPLTNFINKFILIENQLRKV